MSTEDVDTDQVSSARVYDWFLGGGHNFAVDRELAARILEEAPTIPKIARANRAFLARAVRWAVRAGHRQFLDLGSGIPTMGNVHEVAHRLDPAVRVAYVDRDPIAIAHATDLLRAEERVTATRADLRDPGEVLGAPGVADLLDLTQPVVLLAVAVFHFMPDADDPAAIVAGYREAMAPGSALIVSHGSADHDDPADAEPQLVLERLYRTSAQPVYLRDRAELARIATGFTLVDPGMVDLARWRAEHDDPEPTGAYGFGATRR